MNVWITKYLFTKGIIEAEAKEAHTAGMIRVGNDYHHGSEWHDSRDRAVSHALSMIADKRTSIAKQLGKLDKLEAELRKESR